MTDEKLKTVLEEVAEKAANKAINKLKTQGRITYYFSNSFKKTEDLLYLYPNLPEDNPERQRINQAMKLIENDDYYGVIESRYFDKMTFDEISEIYDCQSKNISKQRNKLVRILARELFPEEVLKEIIEK